MTRPDPDVPMKSVHPHDVGPNRLPVDPTDRSASPAWRTAVFPIVIIAVVAAENWLLVTSFGTTRDLGSGAAAMIIVPGANLLAAAASLALIPIARRLLRPRSLTPHVVAATVAPLFAVVADIVYIRSLPLGH